MTTKYLEDMFAALHRTEEYFFTAISLQHQHFAAKDTGGNIQASAYITGIDSAGFNVLYVKEAGQELISFVKSGILLLQNSNLPYSVMVRDALIGTIKEQLEAQTLAPVYTTTAMRLDMVHHVPQNRDASREPHSTVTIQRTDSDLAAWAWPLISAFGITPSIELNPAPTDDTKLHVVDQYQMRHQAALDAQKQLLHFSLYSNDTKNEQPACSLTLSLHDGIARLDDIGTVVKAQGQGYASALIDHALIYAKNQGARHCFLEASANGASLYKRIGFVALFNYTSFEHTGTTG